ncbi:MAG: hypothetical protein OHK0038_21750 [Flammeovirgaceae bacterium]
MEAPFLLAKAIGIPHLKRRRRVWAFLPSDYQHNHHKRYPVIYFHDAQNIFEHWRSAFGQSWEVHHSMRRMAAKGWQESIIIGIEHANRKRIREFTPLNKQGELAEGNAYSDFVANKLKPFVDKKLRTLPDREHTMMMGSSMGGLITFFTGFKHQDVFAKLGVFSPSFWITPTLYSLVKQVGRHYPMKIYLLAGEKEGKVMVQKTKHMYHTLLHAGFPQNELKLTIRPYGEHNEHFWKHEFEECYNWLLNG